jgi:hypothetical protein
MNGIAGLPNIMFGSPAVVPCASRNGTSPHFHLTLLNRSVCVPKTSPPKHSGCFHPLGWTDRTHITCYKQLGRSTIVLIDYS